jgi:hypothetical protein
MSYARLSRRPLLFKSFTGLEIREFDIISKEIESKYYEHERKRLSNRKRKRDVGAGRPFKLKLGERFLMLLVYYRLYITFTAYLYQIYLLIQKFLPSLFSLMACLWIHAGDTA